MLGSSKTPKVCIEAPVELQVNGKNFMTFMCTPEHCMDLAVGHLFGRGLIQSWKDIVSMAVCDDLSMITLHTEKPLSEEEYSLAHVLTSGCGSGKPLSKRFQELPSLSKGPSFSQELLQHCMHVMVEGARLQKETGGYHCTALGGEKGLLFLREDVGRHNTVDKVLGRALIQEEDMSRSFLLTTGRVSSDMLLKAAVARIPLIVSRSIPTSLALEMARQVGITILGRVFRKEPIVFCHGYRIQKA